MSTQSAAVDVSSSLDDFFTVSARRFPQRPALFVADRTWSYAQLDQLVMDIEATVRTVLRGARRQNVALLYGRSALSYAAVIAVMRCDCVYVPLNPGWPEERMMQILTNAAVGLAIIDSSDVSPGLVAGLLRLLPDLQLIVAGEESFRRMRLVVDDVDATRLRAVVPGCGSQTTCCVDSPAVEDRRLAYIIYTSGTTGNPKGVPITHASAVLCIQKVHELIKTTEHDRFSEFSALSFDVSIADLFICWKSAACLFVPMRAQSLVPLEFAVSHRLTV